MLLTQHAAHRLFFIEQRISFRSAQLHGKTKIQERDDPFDPLPRASYRPLQTAWSFMPYFTFAASSESAGATPILYSMLKEDFTCSAFGDVEAL